MKLSEHARRERRRRNRFKTVGGYKFDKYIFRTVMLVIILSTIAYVGLYGFKKNVYVTCNDYERGYCENPLYFDPIRGNPYMSYCDNPVCESEFIPAGFEYGQRPNVLYSILALGWVSLIMSGFVLNHFLHNKPRGVIIEDNREWSE